MLEPEGLIFFTPTKPVIENLKPSWPLACPVLNSWRTGPVHKHWRASEWGVKTRRYIKVFNIRGVSLALLLPLFHLQNYKLLSYFRCEFYLSEPTRHIPSGPLTCLPEEEVFPLVFSLPLPSSPHCHLLATAREEKASSLRGRKKRLPLGCFLWQAWQNNQPSHYGICKQW